MMRYFFIVLLLTGYTVHSQNIDIDLLRKINSNTKTSLDPTFKLVTNSVDPLTTIAPISYVIYALIKKDSASKSKAIFICSSRIFSDVIVTSIKNIVRRERPFITYPDIQKKTVGGSFSFPSGHTSSAFALATTLSIMYPKWYVIAPSFLWAGVAGYSRMHLGAHYPSDVLVGGIVGSGSALLSYKLNRWMNKRLTRRR